MAIGMIKVLFLFKFIADNINWFLDSRSEVKLLCKGPIRTKIFGDVMINLLSLLQVTKTVKTLILPEAF